jgi:hypothetical protein
VFLKLLLINPDLMSSYDLKQIVVKISNQTICVALYEIEGLHEFCDDIKLFSLLFNRVNNKAIIVEKELKVLIL